YKTSSSSPNFTHHLIQGYLDTGEIPVSTVQPFGKKHYRKDVPFHRHITRCMSFDSSYLPAAGFLSTNCTLIDLGKDMSSISLSSGLQSNRKVTNYNSKSEDHH
ncbi:hypothetical protein ACFSRY_18670, partial [Pontibacter locisalis]